MKVDDEARTALAKALAEAAQAGSDAGTRLFAALSPAVCAHMARNLAATADALEQLHSMIPRLIGVPGVATSDCETLAAASPHVRDVAQLFRNTLALEATQSALPKPGAQ